MATSIQSSRLHKILPLRFSLRSLLVAVTAACLLFGLHIVPTRRQVAAVEHVLQLGGNVQYEFQADASGQPLYGPALYQARPRGPKWVRRLLGPHHFNTVVSVRLDDPGVVKDDLRWLAGLPNLRVLELEPGWRVQYRGIYDWRRERGPLEETRRTDHARLHRISGLTELRHLVFDQELSDDGLVLLLGLTKLESLWLMHVQQITDAGLARLCTLTSLNSLYLGETQITDEGLKQLARLPKLNSLMIAGQQLTDSGLAKLKDVRSLKWCLAHNTQIREAAVRELEAARPGLTVMISADTAPAPERGVSFFVPESEYPLSRLGIVAGVYSRTVKTVHPQSPAANAGIVADDVILSIDGKAVTNAVELDRAVHRLQLGGRINVALRRNGAIRSVDVVLDNY